MIPLLVDLEEEWRGGQNQFYLLLKGLYQRGHAAELLAAKGSSLGHRARKAGICVHYTSRESLRLRAGLKTPGVMARVQKRVPLLISRRVGFPIGQSYFSRARFGAATRIIASSQWVAEQAVKS